MITIEQTSDHRLIARLNEEVQNLHAALHPAIFKRFDLEATTTAIEGFMTDENGHAYVALLNDEVIGYVLVFVREAKENAFHYTLRSLYIDQICVLQKHRRSGAGKLLLEQAEKLAKGLFIHRIELDHWSANTVAATYFRKNGFVLAKERLVKIIE